MEGTIEVRDGSPVAPLRPTDVVQQVALIQEVMSAVMKGGEHYGTIPGCGDKPTLLQPGAQILALTFRLAPELEIERTELDGGHREYFVRCRLVSINSGQLVGMGVGTCSTMESKYRWRSGPVEFTGKAVPPAYWDLRKTDPKGAKKALAEAAGASDATGLQTRKNPDTGSWEIVVAGERVENPDIADTYNTVLKIGKKRAFVDAVLNTTAASDMFTQDIEDLPHADEQIVVRVDAAALDTLRMLRDELKVGNTTYKKQLAHYGASTDTALSREAAAELIAAYGRRIEAAKAEPAPEPEGGE